MLKPLPARIPDTLDKTPGSFCTKQFSRCLISATDSYVPDIGWMLRKEQGIEPEQVTELDLPLERLGAGWRSIVEDVGDGLFGGNIPLTPV
jgi:hypothetical protein